MQRFLVLEVRLMLIATRFCSRLLPVLVFVALGIFIPNPVLAGIAFTGDYSPAPASWNSSTNGYVGNTAAGAVTINSGSYLSSKTGYLGYAATGSGTATVDGSGSRWIRSGNLYVGYNGSGTLNITNGGTVGNNSSGNYGGIVGQSSGSTGVATVDGGGSMWTNSGSLAVGVMGNGALSITNGSDRQQYLRWIHRLRFRLDRRGDSRRLIVDQRRESQRRLLWQRHAEHHKRRRRHGHVFDLCRSEFGHGDS